MNNYKIGKCNELGANISRIESLVAACKNVPESANTLEKELLEELECLLSYFNEGDTKVIVELDGGLVQSIQCTDPDVKVLVVDRDSEGADLDEIGEKSEVEEFIGDDALYGMKDGNYKSMIVDFNYDDLLNKGE